MPFYLSLLAWLLLLTPLKSEPWQRPYQGDSARGPDVIAYWNFHPDQPAHDSGPHAHHLEIRGEATRFVADERFGGALEIAPAQGEGEDHREGVAAPSSVVFPEALTLEMSVAPDEALGATAYLLDKKYLPGSDESAQAHKDLGWWLRKAGTGPFQYRMEVDLGFGESSEILRSDVFTLPPGEWSHLAFTYDGQGRGSFTLNGEWVGEGKLSGRTGASLASGPFKLIIGDRVGSVGHRFAGKIASVRISNGVVAIHPQKELLLKTTGSRSVFERMETPAALTLSLDNRMRRNLGAMKLYWKGEGDKGTLEVPPLAEAASWVAKLPIDTRLRPGSYHLTVELSGEGISQSLEIPYSVQARAVPHQMPVVLWDFIQPERWEEIARVGFTHAFLVTHGLGSPQTLKLDEKAILEGRQRLDRAWKAGLQGMVQVSVGRDKEFSAQYSRIDTEGNSYPNLNGNFPQARERARDLGDVLGSAFGDHPAMSGVLIDTEVRDSTRPSFHQVDIEAYGQPIPPEVANRPRGVTWRQLSNFPKDRVIEESHPLLAFYRWFWKEGDGWNRLHTETHRALKAKSHPRLWSWFDPATRVPSLYGSGGEVDVLGQWTYSYPDPLKISLAAEELAAMAAGRPGQAIMNMTQIIWYREQTAPKGSEPQSAWEREQPDADFITIAPDHLEAAFWLQLGHHLSGLMYHGYGSLSGATTGAYRGTHGESGQRLTRLIHEVLHPLAPTLRQIPEAKADVGLLQSFTSQMFAGRGSYGWGNGWGADAWIICRHAGLQPKIVYEEEVLAKGLEGYSVLVLAHCDVLTRPVVEALQAFQARGGVIIGDEFLSPAILPDLLLTSFDRDPRDPQRAKETMLAKADALSKELAPVYRPQVEASDRDLLIRRRSAGAGEYFFLTNDRRTFGDYVGHHQRVMEKGLPLKATVTLHREGGVLYDLVRRQPVALEASGGSVRFHAYLPGAGGGIYLWLPKAAGDLSVTAPTQALRSEKIELRLNRAEIDSSTVIPVTLTLRDPQGREAEGSGPYGMKGGEMTLPFNLAPNDLPGQWEVTVLDGLSGQTATATFELR